MCRITHWWSKNSEFISEILKSPQKSRLHCAIIGTKSKVMSIFLISVKYHNLFSIFLNNQRAHSLDKVFKHSCITSRVKRYKYYRRTKIGAPKNGRCPIFFYCLLSFRLFYGLCAHSAPIFFSFSNAHFVSFYLIGTSPIV